MNFYKSTQTETTSSAIIAISRIKRTAFPPKRYLFFLQNLPLDLPIQTKAIGKTPNSSAEPKPPANDKAVKNIEGLLRTTNTTGQKIKRHK